MWFDYEALFNKTKSFILNQNNNIEVEHSNFEFHLLDSHCLSGGPGENYTL